MLTRGHFIGQIVDDLAVIAAQAKQRAYLRLFDINTYVEDFAKEVLNRVLDLRLTNLNAERSNNPGLDLGDTTKGWAFQVTTEKSRDKVAAMLQAIDSEQKAKYQNIRMLVIGEKQKSYSFNGEPYQSFGFTPEMVWDFGDVCKIIMNLPVDTLSGLAQYISKETHRMLLEFEIPDLDGNFATSIETFVDPLPSPQLSDAAKINAYFKVKYGDFDDQPSLRAAIAELSKKLAKLPRLTREVFKLLVERRDEWKEPMSDTFTISDPMLRRIYRSDDLEGDLHLLMESGLVDYVDDRFHRNIPYWKICFPGSKDDFHQLFIEYTSDLKIDLRKPLVILDFSDF